MEDEKLVEAEQVEEENIKALLHKAPIHPLPEGLEKMERSEKVCRFCGVSYLIFHEFHQLRKQLARLQAELEELREVGQKEKERRKVLEGDREEWEKALHLQMKREAETNEKNTRETLEELYRDMERTLTEEFQNKSEMKRRHFEEECQKRYEEKLKKTTQEMEKLWSASLQKSHKDLEEQRTILHQLKERLMTADATKEEAEQKLEKEKQLVETLRHVVAQQQKALRATRSLLHFGGGVLADARGFLGQLTRAWQALRCQIEQHSVQVFSALKKELQQMTEEKELLTQQLMEQRRRQDEQLCQQENSEKENRAKLLRLQAEMERKHNMWLLCQQNCDALQKQLFSQGQKEEQVKQRYCTAVQEVADLIKDLDKIQEEKKELTKERDLLRESHHATLSKMKADYEKQLSAKIRDVREELLKEAELELEKETEKNQMLLQQCRQQNSQLQQKFTEKLLEVQDLQEELRQERRRRKEERAQDEERKRREEESHEKEAQELNQAKAELQQTSEKNAELIEEVTFLQETVRKECEEREELTAALCQAQQELFGQQSGASHPGSSKHIPDAMERQPPSGHKRFQLQPQVRVPLTLPSTPNTFRPSPAQTEKDRVLDPDKESAMRRVESKGRGVLGGGEKRLEPVLPDLKVRRSTGEVKHKVHSWRKRK